MATRVLRISADPSVDTSVRSEFEFGDAGILVLIEAWVQVYARVWI